MTSLLLKKGVFTFLIGIIATDVVINSIIKLNEFDAIFIAGATTVVAVIAAYLQLTQLCALVSGSVIAIMFKILNFTIAGFNPFLQKHTPHLASLATQSQTGEANLGELILFGLFAISLIATGHGLFSQVKNEGLNEREKRTLKFLRTTWFVFLAIFICLLVILLI